MPDSEFDLIKRWFTGLGAGPQVRLGVGDDAAILDVPADHVLHTSVDTHVAGRHFPIETLPEDVAYRAVASAASDLAAMGAQPLGMLMAITLPEADALWLHGFSQGCHRAALDCGLPLVGGDTTRGPLAITVTVMGSTPPHRWLGRHHARPGDRVCVSGTLGDAAMALSIMAGELAHDELPDAEEIEWLMMRFNRPSPRLALGQHLLGRAHAAIDISDGLLADAAHIAAASGVCVAIDHRSVPLSPALEAFPDRHRVMQWALAGGDDYELLFTLPSAQGVPAECHVIGVVRAGSGVVCDVDMERAGYDHFNE